MNLKGFTFVGAFVVWFVIVTFVSFIVGSIPGNDYWNDSNHVIRWLTACLFFAAYIAWTMVGKNG